jgi:transposase
MMDVVETNGAALVQRIKQVPGEKHVCLEEGTQSEWLYEVLSPHVAEVVVTVPPPQRGNKSDERDAWGLAEMLRRGALDVRVWKAGASSLSGLREAVRARRLLTSDVVRTKNRLRAVFRSRGIVEAGSEVYCREKRGKWAEKLPPSQQQLAKLLGDELEGLEARLGEAEAWLGTEAKKHRIVRRLATVPGIGPLRAAQIVAIVVDPRRFRTKRQLWSYSGLAIVTRGTAQWEFQGGAPQRRKNATTTRGLNRNRQPTLKEVFKGAAHTIIVNMPEHPLRAQYEQRIAAGMKPNLAKITLARTIASMVLAMWKSQEDYDPAKQRRQISE